MSSENVGHEDLLVLVLLQKLSKLGSCGIHSLSARPVQHSEHVVGAEIDVAIFGNGFLKPGAVLLYRREIVILLLDGPILFYDLACIVCTHA